jgi:hypothetical protein
MSVAQEWYANAQCQYERVDTDDFFPENARYPYRDFLYETCARCPVWQTCRIAGLGEPTGWWGGTTMQERRFIRREVIRRNAESVFKDVRRAVREPDEARMFASLKRRGWNITHRSLHQFHYLPKQRDGILFGFQFRRTPEGVAP